MTTTTTTNIITIIKGKDLLEAGSDSAAVIIDAIEEIERGDDEVSRWSTMRFRRSRR